MTGVRWRDPRLRLSPVRTALVGAAATTAWLLFSSPAHADDSGEHTLDEAQTAASGDVTSAPIDASKGASPRPTEAPVGKPDVDNAAQAVSGATHTARSTAGDVVQSIGRPAREAATEAVEATRQRVGSTRSELERTAGTVIAVQPQAPRSDETRDRSGSVVDGWTDRETRADLPRAGRSAGVREAEVQPHEVAERGDRRGAGHGSSRPEVVPSRLVDAIRLSGATYPLSADVTPMLRPTERASKPERARSGVQVPQSLAAIPPSGGDAVQSGSGGSSAGVADLQTTAMYGRSAYWGAVGHSTSRMPFVAAPRPGFSPD